MMNFRRVVFAAFTAVTMLSAPMLSQGAFAQGAIRSTLPTVLTLTPVAEDGKFTALDFTFTFYAPAQRELTLTLPNAWGGEERLYTHWQNLRAENAEIAATDKADVLKLKVDPGVRVRLHYRVLNAGVREAGPGGSIAKSGNDYRPLIAPTHFQVLGNTVVPQVQGIEGRMPARFELKGMPAGASFASDLEHQSMGRALTVADLAESVLVGGDFRVLDAGQGARIAIRGQWPRTDTQWQAQFSKIAKAQRDFWGTGAEPFLVTVLDLPNMGPGSTSIGGTGRSDAFAFFATTNAQPERLDEVMAHEMMHSWVPSRVGGLPAQGEALGYWLSEGFTDWASWRSMVRAGLWKAEDYAKALNERLMAHDLAPVRTAPNSAINEGFWRNPTLQTLPYWRGMLLAQALDSQVRQAKSGESTQGQRSFDDVLLRMQSIAKAAPQQDGKARENLVVAMQEIAGIDITAMLKKHVDEGVPVELDVNSFAPCGNLVAVRQAVFHRGFDVEATQANNMQIQGVVPSGPAYAAGLRNGMTLLKRSGGTIGDSRVEIAYDVQDGTRLRTLRWMPRGDREQQFRELQFQPGMSDAVRALCERRLGGV